MRYLAGSNGATDCMVIIALPYKEIKLYIAGPFKNMYIWNACGPLEAWEVG
jgi:hypothetical protein